MIESWGEEGQKTAPATGLRGVALCKHQGKGDEQE